jgi:hypothetical protein
MSLEPAELERLVLPCAGVLPRPRACCVLLLTALLPAVAAAGSSVAGGGDSRGILLAGEREPSGCLGPAGCCCWLACTSGLSADALEAGGPLCCAGSSPLCCGCSW